MRIVIVTEYGKSYVVDAGEDVHRKLMGGDKVVASYPFYEPIIEPKGMTASQRLRG